jgi:hypothetical protein
LIQIKALGAAVGQHGWCLKDEVMIIEASETTGTVISLRGLSATS